jgi:UDP-N-acetylmuramate--alanine ligase
MNNKKIYVIWVWWIWVSAIARYYNESWYIVYASDSCNSELIETLQAEWIKIIIWADKSRLDNTFERTVYTEAIPNTQEELIKARELNIFTQTYPEALAEIANKKRLIAVAWTHGKSTTTSLISIMMKNSILWINAVIWTLLKEFDWKNTYFSESDFFAIEACEYKRSFLKYKPEFLIITNIEVDHLDYYKDLDDYVSAYIDMVKNIKSGWYLIYNGQDVNCLKLLNIRQDINYISVNNKTYNDWQEINIDKLNLQVPGWHILFDSHLAYTLWKTLNIDSSNIVKSLEWYTWVWRRMELLWNTINNNLVVSDYAHHPTEITLTLDAIKNKYSDKKIITIFQPHQYSRTIELIEDFKTSFKDTDTLIIPNIYESRDSQEDIESMNAQIFLDLIKHDDKIHWVDLKYTQKIISHLDQENKENAVFIILWAWDVDNLRYDIKFQEQKK